jgi:hypothetical protein
MFGWVFGVTVYAASTVWASFMAGLAIGSLLAAKAADRVRRPLAWFGAAEPLRLRGRGRTDVQHDQLRRVVQTAADRRQTGRRILSQSCRAIATSTRRRSKAT